ncbi:two-component system, sensor histidine kinase and response regulator [Azospirillaceae bacterium]
MHRLLQSQLKRVLGLQTPEELESILSDVAELAKQDGLSPSVAHFLAQIGAFISRVDQSYGQFDRDLTLRGRSLQISSEELSNANKKLREETSAQAMVLRSLRETANHFLRSDGKPELGDDSNSLEKISDLMRYIVADRASTLRELETQKFALDQHAIVSITNAKGEIIYANDKFCAIAGYHYDEIIGKDHRAINSGVHSPEFFRSMWGVIKKGRVWEGQICNRKKSGELYWVAATIVPLVDAQGVSTHYIAIRTDITSQKELETKLLKQQRFLQGITDTMGEGVVSLDIDGRCTFINPEAEKLLGYSLADFQSVRFHDAVHYRDKHQNMVSCEQCPTLAATRAGNTYRSDDDLFIRRDGTAFPISIISVPLREGDVIVGSVSVFQDITERRRILDALHKSEDRLKIALEASNTGFWDWNPKTDQAYFSDQWLGMLGYKKGEMAENSVSWLNLLHPDDCLQVQTLLESHMAGKTSFYEVEFRMRHKSGAWTWILAAGRVTERDDVGFPTRMTGIHKDIGDRKESEFQLAKAKEEAERANQLKSDFLANMSHEIRTPMNAVIGLGHLLLKTELTARQRDYLEKMDSAARNLLGIINDILDYSKIEADKLQIESIPFSLKSVLENVSSATSLRASEKKLELIFHVDPDVPMWLIGDPLRLGQILLNLLNNAIKFTEQGEVMLGICVREKRKKSVELAFHVQDTGVGMSEAQQSTLFKPFTQADTSTTRKFGGTGLGLAISMQLAVMMGGGISIISSPGMGSIFTVTVVLGVQEIAEPIKNIPISNLRAIVVDDNALAREILSDMLESFGLVVETASSGAGVLDRMKASLIGELPPIELMIIDWQMPELDGVATLRRLKEMSISLPPIIMISAYGVDGVLTALADDKVAAVLEKPITPSTMHDSIMTVFGRSPDEILSPLTDDAEANPTLLAGMKILLVEDNPINQLVACGLLDLMGGVTQTAGSGEEALTYLRRESFDIILMDIQMPGLDGYEATRYIRQDMGLVEIPIIAMTAHAMLGDRERCLAAGMNDHVAKPIDPTALQVVLERWLPQRRSFVSFSTVASMRSVSELMDPFTGIDLDGIDLDAARRHVNGNSRLLLRILKDFVASHDDIIARLHAGVVNGQWREVYQIAHTLKGVSATFGAFDISLKASELEKIAARNGVALPDNPLDCLVRSIKVTTDSICRSVSVPVSSSSGVLAQKFVISKIDPQIVEKALEKVAFLQEMLEQGNPDSSDFSEELATLLSSSSSSFEAAMLVSRCAGVFDFEDAIVALEKLRLSLVGSLDAA